MTGPITPRQFHDADGVEDWRVLFGGACAHFRTGSSLRASHWCAVWLGFVGGG